MLSDTAAPARANAFKTIVDTIVAPTDAFQAIRTMPTWGWAIAISVVIASICTYLMTPAFQHATAVGFPAMIAHNPHLAAAPPAQQQMILSITEKTMAFSWIFVFIGTFIITLISAAIMALFNALGHGEGSFGKYWAAAANISVPQMALGSIVMLIIILARGATSFTSIQAVQHAVPSLALLAPGAGVKTLAFLGGFTPFSIWGAALVVVAMLTIGRVPKVPAWLAGIVVLVIFPLFALASAH